MWSVLVHDLAKLTRRRRRIMIVVYCVQLVSWLTQMVFANSRISRALDGLMVLLSVVALMLYSYVASAGERSRRTG
jgi:hypothetical protein